MERLLQVTQLGVQAPLDTELSPSWLEERAITEVPEHLTSDPEPE